MFPNTFAQAHTLLSISLLLSTYPPLTFASKSNVCECSEKRWDADIIATGSSLSESDKRIRKNDDERERLERGFSASGWA